MNFLAHLYLAEETPDSRLGNLLGDFVRGNPWDDRFSDAVWQGIMEHRHVDAYTDNHVIWKQSRALLPSDLRRYAGIIIDIYYDYFLSRHWKQFSSTSLEEAVASMHADLISALPQAPDEAVEVITEMVSEKWLLNYRTLDGISETINRVSDRSPSLNRIYGAGESVLPHVKAMEEHFLEFFPELIQYVETLRESG